MNIFDKTIPKEIELQDVFKLDTWSKANKIHFSF
jgi:hypothetical protein